MERWENRYGKALSVALSFFHSGTQIWAADCRFPGCSGSHRRHADSDWHPDDFHKWMELSQIICHSLSLSPSLYDCMSPHCLQTYTHSETHTSNYVRPNCQLPPPLSRSSRPRSWCSAFLAEWGGVWPSVAAVEGTGKGTAWLWAPAGPSRHEPACPWPETHCRAAHVSQTSPTGASLVDPMCKVPRLSYLSKYRRTLPTRSLSWGGLGCLCSAHIDRLTSTFPECLSLLQDAVFVLEH